MGVQMKSNYPTMHLITVEFVREQYCKVKTFKKIGPKPQSWIEVKPLHRYLPYPPPHRLLKDRLELQAVVPG